MNDEIPVSFQDIFCSEIIVDRSAMLAPEFGAFVDRYGPELTSLGKTIHILPVSQVHLLTSFRNGYEWSNVKRALTLLSENRALFPNSLDNSSWEALIDVNELEEILKFLLIDLTVSDQLLLITSDFQMAMDVHMLHRMKMMQRSVLLSCFTADGTLRPYFTRSRSRYKLWADGEKII